MITEKNNKSFVAKKHILTLLTYSKNSEKQDWTTIILMGSYSIFHIMPPTCRQIEIAYVNYPM